MFHVTVRLSCWRKILALCGVVCTILLCRQTLADKPAAALPNGSAFQASAEQLLEVAASGTRQLDDDIELLVDEAEYVYEDRQHLTQTSHQVYRCLRRTALENFGHVQVMWHPWYQDRPQIRARVIAPDKSVHVLDPATIEEVRIPSSDPKIFTDMVMLRAPLPSLVVGAIVETEIVKFHRAGFAESGVVNHFLFVVNQPVRKSRVTLKAPRELQINYYLSAINIEPHIDESASHRTLVFEAGPLDAVKNVESLLPPDRFPLPMIRFTTGQSWSEVAREYAAIVQRQLKDSQLQPLVQQFVRGEQSRSEIAAAILKGIHQNVRYTGVEFGAAAIVPRTPTETWARRYGDCKDQALLMVAMLRDAGIASHVALMKSGGFDVVESLPGMNCFNHAIVYVPGNPPLWIDPSAAFAPVGELPDHVQGQLALIASPETNQLVRTPRSTSADNAIVKTRELTLSEDGTRLTETAKYYGVMAQNIRSVYASFGEQQWRQFAEHVGRRSFGSQSLERLEVTPPDRLDQTFQTTAEYGNVTIANVEGGAAVVIIDLAAALESVPTLLIEDGSRGTSASSPAAANQSVSQRKNPIVLPTLFRQEVHYRIIPPLGYTPTNLPGDQVIPIGSGRLEIHYEIEEEKNVNVRMQFDTGTGVYSPEEVAAAHGAIDKLRRSGGSDDWVQSIEFVQGAASKLAEGRIAEAVAEYHRLLQLEPQQAHRYGQMAEALLNAGLVDEARQYAEKAVQLEPDKWYTHQLLGYVSAHSRAGTFLSRGFSRKEAVDAYRKSIELSPDNLRGRWQLASILELDADGYKYSDDKDMSESVLHSRQVYEQIRDEGMLGGLVCALRQIGQDDAVRELLKSATASNARTMVLLSQVATNEGIDAVQQQAASMVAGTAQRHEMLETVIYFLDNTCQYDAARKLCEALASNSAQPDQFDYRLDWYGVLRHMPPAEFEGNDPQSVVRKLLLEVLLYGHRSEQVCKSFLNPPDPWQWHELDVEFPNWLSQLHYEEMNSGRSRQRITDLLSAFTFTVEGDDTSGYRVAVQHQRRPLLAGEWFVVRDDGQCRVIRAGYGCEQLGVQALQHVAAGQLDSAERWLKWAWERQGQYEEVGWFNAFSGSPFARLWKWEARRDEATLKLVAAALAAMAWPEAVAILEQGDVSQRTSAQQLQVRRALLAAYLDARDVEKALPLVSDLIDEYPRVGDLFWQKIELLKYAGRFDEAVALIEQRADGTPTDAKDLFWLAELATAAGDLAAARSYLDKLTADSDLRPDQLARIAWLWLFQDEVPQQAVTYASQAVDVTNRSSVDMLRVFAAVSAARGEVAAAQGALERAALITDEPLIPLESLIRGYIAEQCGLRDAAIARYRSVIEIPPPSRVTSYVLAQRRLMKLEAGE